MVARMRFVLKSRISFWLLLVVAISPLLIAFRPVGVSKAAPTPTPAHRRRTPTATAGATRAATATLATTLTPHNGSMTATSVNLTGTPLPTGIGPSPTPSLPPPGEIGSTNGIVGWGVVMVAIILAVLLWHRPDWSRRRPPRSPNGP